MKIKEHNCPRCKAKIWFTSEKDFEEAMKKPFLICPICYVPYKLNLDENYKIVSVERVAKQVDIEITVTGPNSKWNVYEPAMPDNVYNSLISIIKLLKLAEQQARPSVLGMVQTLFGDPMSAMFWDQRRKQLSEYSEKQALPNLEVIYSIYPFQVKQMLTRQGLGKYLNLLSTICPKCKSVIPKSRINNCPFCKREGETKEEEDPLKILKLRYAKGEITKEEYEEMKKVLESN